MTWQLGRKKISQNSLLWGVAGGSPRNPGDGMKKLDPRSEKDWDKEIKEKFRNYVLI